MNKYVIRRALAGILITPMVAGGWVLFYGLLVANGAGQAHTINEVWSIGLVLGVMVSLVFAGSAIKRKGN